MYLTRFPSKLAKGDIIWVIEGDLRTPTRFTLADCFEYFDAKHPPFAVAYKRFTIRILGSHSLLRSSSALNRADEWFFKLHSHFITKQKFFNSLAVEPEIVDGLCHISDVKFGTS